MCIYFLSLNKNFLNWRGNGYKNFTRTIKGLKSKDDSYVYYDIGTDCLYIVDFDIKSKKLCINYLVDGIFDRKPFHLESVHNINLFSHSSIKHALERAGLVIVKEMSALPDLMEIDFNDARMSAYVARRCS